MSTSAITDAVVDAMNRGILDNERIAEFVKKAIPGANTTASSVSSIKSRLRKDGHEVPKSNGRAGGGYDLSGAQAHSDAFKSPIELPDHDPNETIEQAKERIAVRYDALERMADRVAERKIPALIISGPPGLGKSYTIERALHKAFPDGPTPKEQYSEEVAEAVDDEDPDAPPPTNKGELLYDIVSGSISAVGLYQALWYTRNDGILVLDDCDDVFRDETALNLLKAALDSKKVRTISWRKEAKWLEDYGILDRFEYRGHIVFLSNIDFEMEIEKGKRDSEHFKALIDRSLYLCLTLRSRRDFMIRIRQVAEGPQGMLATEFDCTPEIAEEVLDFVADNQTRFYNLSLRLVGQVAMQRMIEPERWKADVEATKMRTMS